MKRGLWSWLVVLVAVMTTACGTSTTPSGGEGYEIVGSTVTPGKFMAEAGCQPFDSVRVVSGFKLLRVAGTEHGVAKFNCTGVSDSAMIRAVLAYRHAVPVASARASTQFASGWYAAWAGDDSTPSWGLTTYGHWDMVGPICGDNVLPSEIAPDGADFYDNLNMYDPDTWETRSCVKAYFWIAEEGPSGGSSGGDGGNQGGDGSGGTVNYNEFPVDASCQVDDGDEEEEHLEELFAAVVLDFSEPRLHGPYLPDELETLVACSITAPCYKDITAGQSTAIRNAAVTDTTEWKYTWGGQAGGQELPKSQALKQGDCTDYVWAQVNKVLGNQWNHPPGLRPSVGEFRAYKLESEGTLSHSDSVARQKILNQGYRRVPLDSVRAGDVITSGRHAGVYYGDDADFGPGSNYNANCPAGHLCGKANNGNPARPNKPGEDKETGYFDFTAWVSNPRNGGDHRPVMVFRPVVPCTP